MTRWTDIAPRQETTTHKYAGGMRSHRGVVVHTASGTYDGTIAWQQKPLDQMHAAGESPTSSHFVVAKDGRVCQMLDVEDASWAQSAGNPDWLSIENEGFGGTGGQPLTSAQIEANAQILARAHTAFGVPLQVASGVASTGLGWHAMGGSAWGGHTDCPGPPIVAQLPAIVARAQQITNSTEDDMTPEQDTILRHNQAMLIALINGVKVADGAPNAVADGITALLTCSDLSGVANLRNATTNQLAARITAIGTPPSAATIAAAVAAAVGALQVNLSTQQLGALTTAVTNAVANHPDTPLGDADKPTIEAALRDVLHAT